MGVLQIDTEAVNYEDIYPYLVEKYFGIKKHTVNRLIMNAILICDVINKELIRFDIKPSCKPGCCYCCTSNVEAFQTEMLFLLSFFLSSDEKEFALFKNRLIEWERHYKKLPTMARFRNVYRRDMQACPFLVDSHCIVYPVRPVVCKTHLSLSEPELCGMPEAKIDKHPYAIHLTQMSVGFFLQMESELLRMANAAPLGAFFVRHLSKIEEMKSMMERLSQTVPINERPVWSKSNLKYIILGAEERHFYWPIYQFLDKCCKEAFSSTTSFPV
jgi:hypothetical protein